MFNSKKIAGFFLSITILGTSAVIAQNTQLPQQQQQPQQKVEVDDAELEKFANAFQRVRVISMEGQQEMAGIVENGGLEIKRFNEIHQAELDPAVKVETTQEEKAKHKKIISRLEEIQLSLQEKMEKVITEQGLTPQRYEQIAMGLQNDPELQERLRRVFES